MQTMPGQAGKLTVERTVADGQCRRRTRKPASVKRPMRPHPAKPWFPKAAPATVEW